MSLLEKIKAAALEKRKARDPLAISLTTMLGELENERKNEDATGEMTDEMVQAKVRKTIKNLQEGRANLVSRARTRGDITGDLKRIDAEIGLLEAFMPQKMSEAELEAAIRKARGDGLANIGQIMKYLGANHADLYDGKAASAMIARILSEA